MKYLGSVTGFFVASILLFAGCQSAVSTCGEGEEVTIPDGDVCVYSEDIVIETGFSCPDEFPYLHAGDGTFVCSDRQVFAPEDIEAINDSMGDDRDFRPADDRSVGSNSDNLGWSVGENQRQADVLFVIDNSAGMCAKQQSIADGFERFIRNIDYNRVDLQVGVTTTHKKPEDLPAEFQSAYGALQAQPNPVPNSHEQCSTPELFKTQLQRAVDCTTDPTQFRTELSEGEIACLTDRDSAECTTYCSNNLSESWCESDGSGGASFEYVDFAEAVFPDAGDYRQLDLVLKSSNYENADGTLQRQRLMEDFKCMSLVGTRGWTFEKGLGAAVEAVSPAKNTGSGAPNAGFLRSDARFGVVFVTDENDCTHDGSIDELGQLECRDDICDFENSTQVADSDSALLSIDGLRQQMIDNLRQVKGRPNFTEKDIFVGGVYGKVERYTGPSYTPAECAQDSYSPTSPSCQGDMGGAFSGDRYDRFLRLFPVAYPDSTVQSGRGLICNQQDVGSTLEYIGAYLGAWYNPSPN